MSLYIQRKNLPSILKEVYVDFHWSQSKLWALDIHTTITAISVIDWILDYPVWYLDSLSVPNALFSSHNKDQEHWNRVLNSDLHYPIHVLEWNGRLLVLDGIHRMIKAKILNQNEIKTKVLNKSHITKILPEREDLNTGFLSRAIHP